MAVEGKMQYLFDESGRRYLDVSLQRCTLMVVLLTCLNFGAKCAGRKSELLIPSTVWLHVSCSL